MGKCVGRKTSVWKWDCVLDLLGIEGGVYRGKGEAERRRSGNGGIDEGGLWSWNTRRIEWRQGSVRDARGIV